MLVDSEVFQMTQGCEIDEEGRLDIGSDHNWIIVSINIQCQRRSGGGVKWVWDIKEGTDWSEYQESLKLELQEWKNRWENEGEVQEMNGDLIRRILKVAQEKISRIKVPVETLVYRIDPEVK